MRRAWNIIFVIIVIVVIYLGAKVFYFKEPTGIDLLDQLLPGTPDNMLFAKWERTDEPTYRFAVNADGTWRSSRASGSYKALGTNCLQLEVVGPTGGVPEKSVVVILEVTEETLSTAECTSSCRDCSSPTYKYHKVKYEEKRIMKDATPDHAL